jgi:hypothetical protein
MNNQLDYLGSDQVIAASGFVSGMLWTVPFDKTILEHPLTILFVGSVVGIITSGGASFVADWMPKYMRFTIPVVCASSVFYYKHKEFTRGNKPLTPNNNKPLTPNN